MPYLAQRIICHIDCNSLTAASLRALFVSNREDVRRGALLDQIKQELGGPDEASSIASAAEMEDGQLVVYYNPSFPKYAGQYSTLERRDPAVARSFKSHYEIWLVVHSLLLHNQQQAHPTTTAAEAEGDDVQQLNFEREERNRFATMSAMFATREVQLTEREQPIEVEA